MLISIRKERRIVEIPIVQIRPCRTQARKNYNEEQLRGLALSIRQNGILQPLTVRKISQVEYELLAGERRLRAAAMCGQKKAPCIIMSCTDSEAEIFSLTENLQRTELNFFEEARGITAMMSACHISQQEAARQLGTQQSVIAGKLKMLALTPEEQEIIIRFHLTERHARALLQIDNPTERRFVLSEIIEKSMNVTQTEQYIHHYLCQTKSEKRQHQRQKAIIKDKRIFENTITNAVKVMNNFGITAIATQTETDTYIEYLIRIPRRSSYSQNHAAVR